MREKHDPGPKPVAGAAMWKDEPATVFAVNPSELETYAGLGYNVVAVQHIPRGYVWAGVE